MLVFRYILPFQQTNPSVTRFGKISPFWHTVKNFFIILKRLLSGTTRCCQLGIRLCQAQLPRGLHRGLLLRRLDREDHRQELDRLHRAFELRDEKYFEK